MHPFFIDHQPPIHIFGKNNKLPVLSTTHVYNGRLFYCELFLQNFRFGIKYKKSKNRGNADCLSSLYIMDEIILFQIDQIACLPLKAEDTSTATNNDLLKIRSCTVLSPPRQ